MRRELRSLELTSIGAALFGILNPNERGPAIGENDVASNWLQLAKLYFTC